MLRYADPFGLSAVYSVANYVPLENSDKIGEFRPLSTESAIRCSPIEHYYGNYTIFLALDLVFCHPRVDGYKDREHSSLLPEEVFGSEIGM